MNEEVEVRCPVCGKRHKLKAEIQELECKGRLLVLFKDRLGWRLLEVREITEREDAELDRIWDS